MVNKELLCFVLPYQRTTCVVVSVNWLVSSGNLSALDVNGSEAREIAGDDIVTIGNEESCPWQHHKPENFVTRAPSRLTQLIIVVRLLPKRTTSQYM